jgi:hypothetical protein
MLKHQLIKIRKKGEIRMIDNIDVHDLPENEVRVIQEFVEFIREKERRNKEKKAEGEVIEEDTLTSHPSNVIGKITRREIYDHL